MSRLSLVIFDCDGVLVDSEAISCGMLAQMLGEEGLSMSPTQARAIFQGMRLDGVISEAQRRLGRSLPDGWIQSFERRRSAAFAEQLQPVAGAAEAVAAVIEAGVAVCVASQGKIEKTTLSLKLTGLAHLFAPEALFSAHTLAHGKPAPDLFLHTAARMGTSPDRCAVVEDTTIGVTAAVRAGMRVLGLAVDCDEDTLRRAGAEVISSMQELPARLALR
ncbi:MAG: HAD-IA family hydrolase [Solirubrobacteraceae bacterium]